MFGRKKMTKDEARLIVTRLRRWSKWSTVPRSDVALLRFQVETDRTTIFYTSFILVMAYFFEFKTLTLSWSYLSLLGFLAIIVYCRWDMIRLQKVIRLFEEQGPQMIEDLKNDILNQPSDRTR